MERSAALDPLRADPAGSAVLVDFDGTLAPIVDEPADARPLDGTPELLVELHAVYGCVAVVSGRPLSFLEAQLPAALDLVGLYGLERRLGGRREELADVSTWRPIVDAAVLSAREELPAEVDVEHKGLSLTLHVRRHPELVDTVRGWADEAMAAHGLHARPAKMSVELHPPVQVDKGTVVDDLVGDLRLACYLGDDVGDLAALDALDRLEARGGTAVRAVVSSPEVDPAMLARADLVVPGPLGVRELLQSLLP
jgi:trehalose 6-phosphate phosphatase